MDEREVIIISIQEDFAEAILAGHKSYEFRKTIGDRDPLYVMLYVRERQAVVGGFAPGRVLRARPIELWKMVGGEGTTKERFDQYFSDQERGVALRVRRYERLNPVMTEAEMVKSGVVLPPNFTVLYPTPQVLDILRTRTVMFHEIERHEGPPDLASFTDLELREFGPEDHKHFVALVTEEIGKWYDDIDARFASSIVEAHQRESDPHGLLTLRKEVHVISIGGRRAGYSVATLKRGGCVKFGPTVLEQPYQSKGYAVLVRRRLEALYRERGCRKAYSTIPDTHVEALKYLLRAGYRVEAHLRAHYAVEHGEFILARRLRHSEALPHPNLEWTAQEGGVRVRNESPPADVLEEFVMTRMASHYDGLDQSFVEALRVSTLGHSLDQKPRTTLFASSGDELVGCCVLTPKRGGSIKMAPLSIPDSEAIAIGMVKAAEATALRDGSFRKFYSLVPVVLGRASRGFDACGYRVEGYLTEPYKPGIDMKVYSKFTKWGAE